MNNIDTIKGARIEYIDVIRGIAAALMILGHAFIVYPIDIAHLEGCVQITHIIRSFHMEVFFLLAGIVYKKEPYLVMLKKKSMRILLPYCIWGSLFILVHVYGGNLVNGAMTFREGLYDFFLSSAGYWFLYVLFVMFLAYPVIDFLCRYKTIYKLVFIGFLLIIPNFVQIPIICNFDLFIHHLPFFILGDCITEEARDEQVLTKVHDKRFLILAFGLIGYIILDKIYSISSNLSTFVFFVRALCAITIVYILATGLIHWSKIKFFYKMKEFLCLCSKYSLQIYLFEGYFLVVSRTLICKICGVSNPFIVVPFIWIVDLIPTLLICQHIIVKSKALSIVCGVPISRK